MKDVFKMLESRDTSEILIQECVAKLFVKGGADATLLEVLSYVKILYPDLFEKYEQQILIRLGLFFKNPSIEAFEDNVFQIYKNHIKAEFADDFIPTPVQADIVGKIKTNKVFSFSSPTSTGKSYIFRYLLSLFEKDIVIVVPSRALINEYYKKVYDAFQNDKLVNILTFIDKINTKKVSRNIFIITPERARDLFNKKFKFDIDLILFDEAQLSEDRSPRGMFYDSIIRRAVKCFSQARFIFAYPFITNPEAQFVKNNIEIDDRLARTYPHKNVGQIFYSFDKTDKTFAHFGVNRKIFGKDVPAALDPLENVLMSGGSALIYCAKANIYDKSVFREYKKYLVHCPKIENNPNLIDVQKVEAQNIIDKLSDFIGATDIEGSYQWSLLIALLKRGVVMHHGSIPLTARSLIEEFTQKGFCKLCFATSTLEQGINMPFDLVWIYRFNKSDSLGVKNLIGRAGRSTTQAKYDYGQIVIKKTSINDLRKIVEKDELLNNDSLLDDFISDPNDDYKEYKEAIKNDALDEDFNMALTEVARLKKEDVLQKIEFIIEKMFEGGKLEIKRIEDLTTQFIEIYESYLNRPVEPAERYILNTMMQILFWRVQGRRFSQIVSFRYSYIARIKERKDILKAYSHRDDVELFDILEANYSPIYQPIPNKKITSIGLNWDFVNNRKLLAKEIDYDRVMVDTYDYIDKIIGFRVGDVYFCAFTKYYENETKDLTMRAKALRIAKVIRYGTDDEKEIMLLRYGFDFEDFEWLLPVVEAVSEEEIIFGGIESLSDEQRHRIERFI